MGLSSSLPFDDWITAANAPADPDLYFIGTFDRRITFYSQQVRGLRLVHALHERGKLKSNDHIAVVGAGAAGISFALGAALRDYRVTLHDPANEILQLQSASPKLLHPHIYEWPDVGSLDARAGLPVLDWVSGKGADVQISLATAFAEANTRLDHLRFEKDHKLAALEQIDKQWHLTFDHNGTSKIRTFQKVILAMGFGDETICGAAQPTHYWRPTGVGTAALEETVDVSYLTSGNGDGALTEALGLLVSKFEHVTFTETFLTYVPSRALRDAAVQAIGAVADGEDLEAIFKEKIAPVLESYGVIDALRPKLRKDRRVTLNSSGPLLAAGRASLLNQVMVFAVLLAAAEESVGIVSSQGHMSDAVAEDGGFRPKGLSVGSVPLDSCFKHVIVRHGPARAARYAPAKGPFERYKAHIDALLAAKPDLAKAPHIEAETFEFFDKVRIERLVDGPAQQVMITAGQSERARILVAVDAASHVLVERGFSTLAEVAQQCERLTEAVTVHLALSPEELPCANQLVRLSRASMGRIILTTNGGELSSWTALWPAITAAPQMIPRYAPRALDGAMLCDAIDDCLLRSLDLNISKVVAGQVCPTLDNIDSGICVQIAATWAVWKASLEASAPLRFDFLRWLANIEQSDHRPWDGDHAQLNHMTSALVMMLAAHIGEALTPASVGRGNLQFSTNAEALGSGGSSINGAPLTRWKSPDEWGVDALILSGSAEVTVYGPNDTLLNGGTSGSGLMTARRVRPAIIRNDEHWRSKLSGPIADWTKAVRDEFDALAKRQNDEAEEASK